MQWESHIKSPLPARPFVCKDPPSFPKVIVDLKKKRKDSNSEPLQTMVQWEGGGLWKAAAKKAHLWLRTVSGSLFGDTRYLLDPSCTTNPIVFSFAKIPICSVYETASYTVELKGGEKRGCRQKGCGAQLGFGLGFVKESCSELVPFEQTTDHFYWKSHRGLSIKTLHRR